MALNYIWVAFFVIGFVVALIKLIFFGDVEVFSNIVNGTFSSAKGAFELALYLTGTLALWMGLMRVGEEAGMVQVLTRIVRPFFSRLFPEVPEDHKARGSMMMNFAANMLNLGNAATPLGLKAMKELQELNPKKDTASNAQIMFLVLNTSGLTLIPVSVMAIRSIYIAQEGIDANPAEVFIPILLTTFCSTIVGLTAVSIYQRIQLFQGIILAYLGSLIAIISTIIYFAVTLPATQLKTASELGSSIILLSIMVGFLLFGVLRKVQVYNAFIEGAKEGFNVAVRVIPYLVAILVGIGIFRNSGAMDMVLDGIRTLVAATGMDTRFVDALPTGLMRPLSGSGAESIMVDIIKEHKVDSFAAKLASTFMGSTDTTFYVIALYFGSAGIRNTRYAVQVGLIADFAGIFAAIFFAYLFYA